MPRGKEDMRETAILWRGMDWFGAVVQGLRGAGVEMDERDI